MTLKVPYSSAHRPALQILAIFVAAVALLMALQMFTSSTASAARPKGYLVIYNESGRFDTVKISLNSGASVSDWPTFLEDHRCGGVFTSTGTEINRKLSTRVVNGATTPRKVKCSPANADIYRVAYGKKGQSYRAPISVDVNDGYCTTVHPDGHTAMVAISGSTCPSDGYGDAPSQLSSNTTLGYRAGYTTYLSKNKRYILGTVKIRPANGEDLLKPQCKGDVDVTYAPGKVQNNLGLKLVKKGDGTSYCQAKFSSKSLNLTAGSYSVSAHFNGVTYDGVTYLQSSDSPSTDVTIPARRR